MTDTAVTYPLITRDAILDGMVAALADVTANAAGVTEDRYFYSVDRYMGELSSEEAFKRGLAGRCPAVRMAWVADRSIKKTIGRRSKRNEATLVAIVFSDSSKSKDDRSTLLTLSEKVEKLIGSRAFGLAIEPLTHRSTTEMVGVEHCTAYGVTFMTRYRVDYTIDPGVDVMESATGDVHTPEADEEQRIYGEIDVALNQETEA